MYEITITKSVAKMAKIRGEWNSNLNGGSYEPSFEKEVIEKQEIYKQQIEGLDLVAVINAVNKIPVDAYPPTRSLA